MKARPGPRQVGAFVRQQAEELTRIWRLARQAERTRVAPGLLDGIVEPFLGAAGTLLERDAPPEEAIHRAAGIVRWAPPLCPGELSAEWRILGEVLATACDQANAEAAALDWLSRAVAAAEGACVAADGGRGAVPGGVVVVVSWTRAAAAVAR